MAEESEGTLMFRIGGIIYILFTQEIKTTSIFDFSFLKGSLFILLRNPLILVIAQYT